MSTNYLLLTMDAAFSFSFFLFLDYCRYWSVFNDALLAAAVNNKVNVRLLISSWNHTRKAELKFLKSLEEVSGTYKNVDIQVVRILKSNKVKCTWS